MLGTLVQFLGWEDPLEKGKATHSSILLENSMDYSPWGGKESDVTKQLSTEHTTTLEPCLHSPDCYWTPAVVREIC